MPSTCGRGAPVFADEPLYDSPGATIRNRWVAEIETETASRQNEISNILQIFKYIIKPPEIGFTLTFTLL
jgi:hypothetical protein